MGIRERLSQSLEDLDKARLQDRFNGVEITKIVDAPARQPVRVGGEVQAVQVVPRAGSPSLEVTVNDGSARVVAVFTGRKAISGVACGRGILVEGVGRMERNRLTMLNPAYTLLP
jgi:RecG-like helicase